jgi:hypothetical protein
MKSHDHHIMIQQIFPACVKNMLLLGVCQTIIRLSKCFQKICMKVVDPHDIPSLKVYVVETLFMLEIYFLPGFFDISTHLSTLYMIWKYVAHLGPNCVTPLRDIWSC